MIRKIAAALLGVGVLVPGVTNALGLGDITLNSALSEPLSANIELVQVRELGDSEIIPTLASTADFKSSGVERFHSLSDIKFQVVISESGQSYIKVSSRKPIKEPFLNFLVEVNWPTGRLLREYTLLLDPPTYTKAAPSPVAQAAIKPILSARPVATPAETSAPLNKPTAKPEPTVSDVQPEKTQAPAQTAESQKKTYGPTSSSDNLWSIAKSLRPAPSISIQQMMVAIQQLNPNAFIRGNINLLKKGQVLQGPTEQEARSITARQAIAQVSKQNKAWKQRNALATKTEPAQLNVSVPKGNVVDTPTVAANTKDQLKLLSTGGNTDAESGLGGQSNASNGSLQDAVDLADENADKFRLESDELKVKVSDLQGQVDTTERLISLKDDQILALQAKLAALETQVNDANTVQSDVEPTDFNYDAASETPVIDASASDSSDVADTPAQAVPVPAPPVNTTQSIVETLTNNPLYLAIAGSALVVVFGGLFAVRRRKDTEGLDETLTDNLNLSDVNIADEPQELGELPEHFVAEDIIDDTDSSDGSALPESSEVLSEADIYIAYGRFSQAIEMLEKAIESEPERVELFFKVIEVAAESGDIAVFDKYELQLQAFGDDVLIARTHALRAKLPSIDEQGTISDDESNSGFVGESHTQDYETDYHDTAASDNEFTNEPVTEDSDVDASMSMDFNLDLSDAATETTDDDFGAPLDDLSLDFDTPDTEPLSLDDTHDVEQSADEAPVIDFQEAEDSFDLDVDEDLALDVDSHDTDGFDLLDTDSEESLLESDSADALLDSDSAAKLAEELDLDDDLEFDLGDTEEAEDTEAVVETVADESLGGEDEDLEFLSDTDEVGTKLDLARAYFDMGDREGAKDILDEVVADGDDAQQQDARELLAKLD